MGGTDRDVAHRGLGSQITIAIVVDEAPQATVAMKDSRVMWSPHSWRGSKERGLEGFMVDHHSVRNVQERSSPSPNSAR